MMSRIRSLQVDNRMADPENVSHETARAILRNLNRAALTVAALLCLAAPFTCDAADMAELRKQAAQRTRRIIFNNDSDDYTVGDSIEAFLASRTTPLLGSHVDTVFYSTDRSGFVFAHRTEVARMIDDEAMRRFLARETDPLQVMTEFCHEHDIEMLWSLRMNDVHDAYRPSEWLETSGSIKNDRPDLIMGKRNDAPPHGAWSAYDYGKQDVRDLVVAIVAEVARNYDVEGVELDFFRHPMFFRSVAWGQPAGPEQWAQMTDVVRKIREALDREGTRRGRPFLLAVRTPDDLEYNRQLGLDLETWLREGWVDLFIPTGYFQLRPWSYSVELGHRYGAKVYPCLSESRIISWRSEEEARRLRQHPRGYRGRALNAWDAGADGIYLFNLFNPRAPQWRELGDPQLLKRLDRDYFASIRGEGRGSTWPHKAFIRIPTLNPDSPLFLRPGQAQRVRLRVGEDLSATQGTPNEPRVSLHILAPHLSEQQALTVSLNDTPLSEARQDGDWFVYSPPVKAIKRGWNAVAFRWDGKAVAAPTWDMTYECDHKLAYPRQLPWRRAYSDGERAVEQMVDGHLLLGDRSTDRGAMTHLVYPWRVQEGEPVIVEARLKVLGNPDPKSVVLRLADGQAAAMLEFMADRIRLAGTTLSHSMDTTAAFHTYRVELADDTILVSVDGQQVIDGKGRFTQPVDDPELGIMLGYGITDWYQRSLYIGSASAPGRGEALWDTIRYRSLAGKPLEIDDLMLRVDVPE